MIRFVRISDACRRLGLSRSKVYRLIGAGELPPLVHLPGGLPGRAPSAFVETEFERAQRSWIRERDRELANA